MRQERIKTIVAWLLVAICMVTIFWFSSRNSDQSNAQSGTIVNFLISIFGDGVFTDFIVRKLAHFLEYTVLCLLVNIAFWQTRKIPAYLYAVAISSLYAVTDEIHQIFVPGRSCQLRDWLIDTGGALVGAIIFAIVYFVVKRIKSKKQLT